MEPYTNFAVKLSEHSTFGFKSFLQNELKMKKQEKKSEDTKPDLSREEAGIKAKNIELHC